jgi:N-acetylneuraminate synthase
MSRQTNVVAEIGSVHDGSFGNALKLLELAARLGADTVKFQTHIAEAETTRDAPAPAYFAAEDRFSYFTRTGFSKEQWKTLRQACDEAAVTFLSSPFSQDAVDLLEDIGVSGYKIASGEVTNLPMLRAIAETGKPVLLSSGMSDWAELDRAVSVLSRGGPLVVMQCTSAYPCPPERVGLNVLADMRARYGLPVGFSDHTDGIAASIAAVAHGAEVVEKHLTFSRAMYGSDAANAAEPDTFAAMVRGVREVDAMLAHPLDKNDVSPFKDMKRIFEKSVVTRCPVAAGTLFTVHHLAIKKPGTGLPPARFDDILGCRAKRDLPPDHLLSEDDIEAQSPQVDGVGTH